MKRAVSAAAGLVVVAGVMLSSGFGASPMPVTARAVAEPGRMRIYVGTYTGGRSRGIYLLEFDAASGTFVSAPVMAATSDNPSFLALHPGGRFLYSVNELNVFRDAPTGGVSAFAIDSATGRLTLLNQQPSEGRDPCYLVVDPAGRNLLVANYTSGTVTVLPLSADGRLQPASTSRQRSGSGPVHTRQEGPHAHAVALDAAGRFAISTDLGADRVVVERYDAAAGRLEPNDPDGVRMAPGSGPRHVAWHPSGRMLYVLNELNATVSVLRFDADRGALEIVQTIAARPAEAKGENTAAEIAVSRDGRFLYASNRGDDTIVVFSIDGATLTLARVGQVGTGGRTPRHFAVDPTGRWLIAANQGSDSLVVFRLDATTGLPVATGISAAVPEPVCVLFAPSSPLAPEAPAR